MSGWGHGLQYAQKHSSLMSALARAYVCLAVSAAPVALAAAWFFYPSSEPATATNHPFASEAPAPEPIPTPPLRDLASALQAQKRERSGQLAWQCLACIDEARSRGILPGEFLAVSAHAENLDAAESSSVQDILLAAWSAIQDMALVTPDNLELMQQGEAPRATRGPDAGCPVLFDTGTPTEMTLKVVVGPRYFDRTRVTTQTLASSDSNQSYTQLPYEVKYIEARLREKLPLDAYGMTNMDLRLDKIDRGKAIQFALEDRATSHLKGRQDAGKKRQANDREHPDIATQTVTFKPEPIPDTATQGVRLAVCGLASIYLEESPGTQAKYRIVIRLPGEMLILDKLSPERRKLYEYRKLATASRSRPR